MNKITLALIIAKPGHLRNGLQSLLRSIPQIEILAESNDPSILSKMEKGIHPDLILVDAYMFDESNWAALKMIKKDWPSIHVLMLTENDEQGQAAKDAGADFYLLKGFHASELANLIETLLKQQSGDEINPLD